MKRKQIKLALFGLALVVASLLELVPRPAHAIIGMPLTPMSYAGVARRTTRRAAVYGAAAYGAAPMYAPPVYGAPYGAPVVAPRVYW
jgi:hypothetical protein